MYFDVVLVGFVDDDLGVGVEVFFWVGVEE